LAAIYNDIESLLGEDRFEEAAFYLEELRCRWQARIAVTTN